MAGVVGSSVRSPALPEDAVLLMAGVVGSAARSSALRGAWKNSIKFEGDCGV